jgi:hypothetical protein
MMRQTAPLFLFGLLTSACAEDGLVYSGTEFEVQSAPPAQAPASFEPDRIELVAGVAVKVLAIPHSSGEVQYQKRDLLTLRPENAGVLEVYHTEKDHEFVLVGVEPGQTCLEVTINRDRLECIDVRVLPPVTE